MPPASPLTAPPRTVSGLPVLASAPADGDRITDIGWSSATAMVPPAGIATRVNAARTGASRAPSLPRLPGPRPLPGCVPPAPCPGRTNGGNDTAHPHLGSFLRSAPHRRRGPLPVWRRREHTVGTTPPILR